MSQAPLSSKTVAAEATEKRISPDRPCRSSGPLFPDSLRGGPRSPLRSRSGTGTRGFGLGAVSRVHVAFRLPFSRRRHVPEFGVGEWLRTLWRGASCVVPAVYTPLQAVPLQQLGEGQEREGVLIARVHRDRAEAPAQAARCPSTAFACPARAPPWPFPV